MGAKRRKLGNHGVFHASYNLEQEWNASCARAMGIERLKSDDKKDTIQHEPIMNVINLLPPKMATPDPVSTATPSHDDAWLQSAIQISMGLDHMSSLLARKRQSYASVSLLDDDSGMTEEERSVLESTVLSFSATTGNQIESLRQQAEGQGQHHHDCREAHRAGIVACLFQRLRRQVADPMAALQKERSKNMAVNIMKEPLRCEFVSGIVSDDYDELLDGPPPDKRFLPRKRAEPQKINVKDYIDNDDATLPPRPVSRIIELAKKQRLQETTDKPEASTPTQKSPSVRLQNQPVPVQSKPNQSLPQTVLPYNNDDDDDHHARLEQESALLEAELQSDLDGVQKVEQTMTEITSLLTQFSNLVAEQQEEIMAIHDDTVASKSNVTKGQDSLLEAKRRTQQSKHYMATFVMGMALVLLFFNWITP